MDRIIHVPFDYEEVIAPYHKAGTIKVGWDIEFLVRATDEVLAHLLPELREAGCNYYEIVDSKKVWNRLAQTYLCLTI